MIIRKAVLLCFGLIFTPYLESQNNGTVTGRVFNSINGMPISNAIVGIYRSDESDTTDLVGTFI